ncbi:HTH_Tnp_Tc3_2 domain-containing protein [Trichonephila clavipes]|nr:HTH_Tnp_Tc3_2 domain-containing protein [Trichonephila clavipes]
MELTWMIFLGWWNYPPLEYGRAQIEVSEELGLAQRILSRFWQRFQDNRNVSTSSPRVTTPNADKYLAVFSKRSKRCTAPDVSHKLSSAMGKTVSRKPMYKRLGHIMLADVFHSRQLFVASGWPEEENMQSSHWA